MVNKYTLQLRPMHLEKGSYKKEKLNKSNVCQKSKTIKSNYASHAVLDCIQTLFNFYKYI